MTGAKTSNGRAPNWHRRPAGASFGFGGRLASFSKVGTDGASPHSTGHGQQVSLLVVVASRCRFFRWCVEEWTSAGLGGWVGGVEVAGFILNSDLELESGEMGETGLELMTVNMMGLFVFLMEHVISIVGDVHERRDDAVGPCLKFSFSSISGYLACVRLSMWPCVSMSS